MDDEPLTSESIRAAVEGLREAHKTYVPPTFEEMMAVQPWAIQLSWAKLQRETLARAVWNWIIDANNGVGGDVDDLIQTLGRLGTPCPPDMEDKS